MSKKDMKRPKPGAKLKAIKDLEDEIKIQSARLIDGIIKGGEFDEFLKGVLTTLESDPDAARHIIWGLATTAEDHKQHGDRNTQLAFAMDGAAFAIEERVIEKMKAENKAEISGEVWKFELIEEEPTMRINPAELPEYLQLSFVKKEPNSELIKRLIALKETIPGVTMVSENTLKMSVIKKGDEDVRSKEA